MNGRWNTDAVTKAGRVVAMSVPTPRRIPRRAKCGTVHGRENPPPLLEPDAEVAEDEVRLASHLTSPPSAAGWRCSGGMRRSGPSRPDRGRVPGRRTAATHTCTADGSGTRAAD